MNKYKYPILIGIGILLIAGYVIYTYRDSFDSRTTGNSENIGIEKFIALAQKDPCAQARNDLYTIDGEFVFWAIEGYCSDGRYGFTLFGQNPDEILCTFEDSIAGSRKQCSQAIYDSLFDQILSNKEQKDLGLSPKHNVKLIYSRPVAK